MKRGILITLLILAMSVCLLSCAQGEKGAKGDTGVGVADVEAVNGELTVTYTDGRQESLGKIAELLEAEKSDLDFYPLDDGTYAVGCGNSIYLSNIVIPEEYNGKAVSAVANEGFKNCENVKSIVLPDSVTSIGSDAFYGCSALESINIPSGISEVGARAFFYCDSLVYSEYENASYLGNEENPYLVLVKASSLYVESCEINESTKIICDRAFARCTRLTEITVPEGVECIGDNAFIACDGLVSIELPFMKNKKGEDGAHFGYLFGAATYNENNKYVPKSLKNVVLTGGDDIADYAFFGCMSIENVTVGEGATAIGERAFYNCVDLVSAEIPDSVTSIGSYAFYNCVNLKIADIPSGVSVISDNVFRACTKLEGAVLPAGVKSIGNGAFSGCKTLESIVIPAGVERIENDAFRDCSALTIYCEAAGLPNGWNLDWNYSGCKVVWGVK